MSKKTVLIGAAVIVVAGGAIAWVMLSDRGLPPGFAGGNGRLEAQQVDIATKYAGRIKEVLAKEGDTVDAGQVVAVMDTEPLEAQLRQSQAKIKEAQDNRRAALAQVTVKKAELDFANQQYKRAQGLVGRGAISQQELETDQAQQRVAQADLVRVQAQSVQATSSIDAAVAESERLAADIKDNTLKAPLRARVERRLAEPGEVLGAGGKVLSTSDLSDVYMYIFLPTSVAGKIALGSEARLVLDALPGFPIKAVVSFVSPSAQFTPKTVETAEERHNLSFRVKLQLDKEKLRNYERLVKVGIPGMGYVRYDEKANWPPMLQLKPLTELPWAPSGAAGPGGAPAGAADSAGSTGSGGSGGATAPTGQ